MDEHLLPEELISKASISNGNEHAWKMDDVLKVIEAARKAGLANLGGQPQFQGPIGIAELYWLNFEPMERKESEVWSQYVDRSASEAFVAFNAVCEGTNFETEAIENWKHIKSAVDNGVNVYDHLWFVLYFERGS